MTTPSDERINGDTPHETPKCGAIFDEGIENSRELIRGLSALLGDLALSRIVPARANAMCNAAGKILTTVNLEYKYGLKADGGGAPTLSLAGDHPKLPRPGSSSGRAIAPPRARAR
jgi:hypothetical protein